jgi:Fe2+ or Zn2+ uptake regulation protein
MTRLQYTARTEAAETCSAYRPHSAAPAEKEILEAEKRVSEQEAHVLRLIVQGAPTQSAEDLLRQLMATAKAMKEQRRLARG